MWIWKKIPSTKMLCSFRTSEEQEPYFAQPSSSSVGKQEWGKFEQFVMELYDLELEQNIIFNSPKALNLRLWCFPALYCSTYIFVIKTNTESTQPLATQTQDAVVSTFICEVFEDLCWTSSSLTFSEKLMEVLLYTIIFAPDPLMTSEIMEKNGVTWCYFNQIFLYHWGRESVCFLFFICLPEGRLLRTFEKSQDGEEGPEV